MSCCSMGLACSHARLIQAELDRDVNASVNIARRGLARARKSARTRLWGNRSKREAGVVTPRQSRLLRSRVLLTGKV